jgi:hypothetical protein
MTTDKTGAEATVNHEADRFTIIRCERRRADCRGRRTAVKPAGCPSTQSTRSSKDAGWQRSSSAKALEATKDSGPLIVPVCELVAAYVEKHSEFSDVVDPPTPEIEEWFKTAT